MKESCRSVCEVKRDGSAGKLRSEANGVGQFHPDFELDVAMFYKRIWKEIPRDLQGCV